MILALDIATQTGWADSNGKGGGMNNTFVLPFPPSVNSLFAGKERRHLSKAYKAWIKEASHALRQQRPLPHYTDKVCVEYVAGWPCRKDGSPSNRVRDISNFIKAPEDLLVKFGVLEDDSLVEDMRIRWDRTGTVTGIQVNIEVMP